MHFHKHLAMSILSGALMAAVPFCMAQAQSGQQQAQHPKQGQAAAHPSRSMANANQRAANLLNTINKTEIDGAQNIQGHVNNADIKSYAQDLVNDHKNLQDQLQKAADQAKIDLKENPAMEKQAEHEDHRLDQEKPAQAGASFVAAQIRDHKMAVKRLQRLEPHITDPQLKSVVQSAIPVMQKHLTEAQKLQSQMKSGNGGLL